MTQPAARALAAAAICALCSSAAAEDAPLTLHFDFFYNGVKAAEVSDVYAADKNGGYEIASHARAIGLAKLLYGDVVRKSAGRRDAAGDLRPLRYEEKRGPRPRAIAEIDEKAGVIRLQKGGETRIEKIPPNAPPSDYLTALYRPHSLRRLTPGKTAATDGWRLKVYDYAAGDAEAVQTPAGEWTAIPLLRESPRGRRIIWFAPELRFLPIKIRIEDKGHVFETVLAGGGFKTAD